MTVLVSIVDADSSPTISVDTPCWTTPSTAIIVTGKYFSTAPSALDYSTDGGSTWAAGTSATIGNGNYAFTIGAGFSAGTYVIKVRDHNATYRQASSGTVHVSAWQPSSLSNLVACFDPNNMSATPDDGIEAVSTLQHIYDPTQFLYQPTVKNRPWVVRGDGADGKHRILKFQTAYTATVADHGAHFMPQGGTAGSFQALFSMANTTNFTTGNISAFCSGLIDRTNPYHCFFIWGQGNAIGPAYWEQVRINGTDHMGAQGFALTPSLAYNALWYNIQNGWHTFGVVKNGAVGTFYLDGTAVATSTTGDTTAFTTSAIDGDFVIGGSLVSGAAWTGQPPPKMGGSIFAAQALSGSDLTNTIAWCSASAGMS